MDLTLQQIQEAARGIARIEQTEDLICMSRFTEEQQKAYWNKKEESYIRTLATAGVVLEFKTNSSYLILRVEASRGSSRRWFSHSVFVDGNRIGLLEGSLGDENEPVEVEGTFQLGQGRKTVKIVFPWSVCSKIKRLSLEDGADFSPVKKARKMLIFGDSISQGYDAKMPENAYANQLAEYFDADAVSKAIGGETFWPELADMKDDFVPEIISVAYGTNDWSHRTWDVIENNSRAFYGNLRNLYPNAKILALAPIWRADWQKEKPSGDFHKIAAHLRVLADEIENMTVIDCFDFVPQDRDLFSDRSLHPNDAGFLHYFNSLREKLEELNIR